MLDCATSDPVRLAGAVLVASETLLAATLLFATIRALLAHRRRRFLVRWLNLRLVQLLRTRGALLTEGVSQTLSEAEALFPRDRLTRAQIHYRLEMLRVRLRNIAELERRRRELEPALCARDTPPRPAY